MIGFTGDNDFLYLPLEGEDCSDGRSPVGERAYQYAYEEFTA